MTTTMTTKELHDLNRAKATQREIYIRLIAALQPILRPKDIPAIAEKRSEEATEQFHPGFRALAQKERQIARANQ